MIDLPPIRFKTTGAECQLMHEWFCTSTRQAVRWTADAERMWFDALVRFSASELHQVLVEVVAQVKRGGHAGALRLRNFLSLENLEERLQTMGAARRLGKVSKPPLVVETVQEHDGMSRIIEVPRDLPTQPIAQVMPGALRAFADSLGKPKSATVDSAPDCRPRESIREGMDISSSAGAGIGKMDI